MRICFKSSSVAGAASLLG